MLRKVSSFFARCLAVLPRIKRQRYYVIRHLDDGQIIGLADYIGNDNGKDCFYQEISKADYDYIKAEWKRLFNWDKKV